MLPRRRLLVAVAIAAIIALPAGVLAGLCVGNACRREERPVGRVPFCSLPGDLRSLIAAGFRDGRSPHVFTVTPEGAGSVETAVPIAFAGTGVAESAQIPKGTTLDAVAPTVAEIIELRRPHPGVRSGEPLEGIAVGDAPRLVLLVAWKGVSSRELERKPNQWPVLRGMFEDGAGTLEAVPGSLPLDSAALVATIGTGALPRDHGITGAIIRNDLGEVVEPWSEDAPFSVVTTLADDLDELGRQAPRIGLIGQDETDRGLVGGSWYVENDTDDVVITASLSEQVTAAERVLTTGYGEDSTTDLLGVAMEGTIPQLDRALGLLLTAAERASAGSFAVAFAGAPSSLSEKQRLVYADELAHELRLRLGSDVTEEIVPSGVFLDQGAMTRTGLTDDRVVAALRQLESAEGDRAFLDVFPAIAVTFARYC